jgi:hypothetical protein
MSDLFRFLTPAVLLSIEALLLTTHLWPARQTSHSEVSSWIQSVFTLYSVAHIPYLVAVYWVKSLSESRALWVFAWCGALALRLLLFSEAPVLSDDLNRYEWESRVWESGANPYRIAPRETATVAARIPGPDDRAVYGPVLELAHYVAFRAGNLKLSAILAETMLLIGLWLFLRRGEMPVWRWALYAWSPLPAVEFWREGHNDSWLIFWLFIALALHTLRWKSASWVAWTLAIFTKWWPALWLPWMARRAWSPLGLAILGAASLSVYFSMEPEFWINRVRFTTGFLGGWQNNAFLYRFLNDKTQAAGILLASACTLPFWQTNPFRLMLYWTSWLLAWSANIHPWYLAWTLPFVALEASRPLPWLLAAALSPLFYEPVPRWVLLGEWREDGELRVGIWSVITIYSFVTYWRFRNR